ncbi:hypothetical protein DSO57_1022496 [Entomophthora muscae]|uniref:Uncharacterized protein n=1 Tax=Entomophthora muscae TaxID=34485 RepID=A0ACC2UNZ8_9FUNG|nr:hypothetical protein DSO57_1022496 [Entomophthora muscae]
MKLVAIFQALVVAEFDYIVVGSGPGGGTLATELALKGFKTLLIEAGPDYFRANQSTPAFHAKASEDPASTFGFDVKHYNNGEGYFYPRASVLGGGSVDNAMVTIYPNSRDFALMQRITGDSTWFEENMRRYFKKLEGNQYLNRTNHSSHGFDGWFKTSLAAPPPTTDSILNNYLQAGKVDPGFDINGHTEAGLNTDREANMAVPQAVDKKDFSRVDFPKYIRSVAAKSPLTIWTDTFVTRVLFEGKAAVGVAYTRGRHLYKASLLRRKPKCKARPIKGSVRAKEVILSGGVFNTPQLLMLSGVGDKHHLKKFNIPVVANLPGVGRNMMDRYEVPIVLQYPRMFKLLTRCRFTPTQDDPCYQMYLKNHTGPYVSNGILYGQLRKSHQTLGEPDLFILNGLSNFHGYFRGYSKYFTSHPNTSTRLILKAHTSNTNGRVKLRSANPFDVPDINFHSFSDGNTDLDILVEALVSERKTLKASLHVHHQELYPGTHIRTKSQIRKYIKQVAWGHHACCTAKMGSQSDPNAVVDPHFNVRHVKNLRIVDMSIFPKIPGYFPTVYIHMVAMKAADTITKA